MTEYSLLFFPLLFKEDAWFGSSSPVKQESEGTRPESKHILRSGKIRAAHPNKVNQSNEVSRSSQPKVNPCFNRSAFDSEVVSAFPSS